MGQAHVHDPHHTQHIGTSVAMEFGDFKIHIEHFVYVTCISDFPAGIEAKGICYQGEG